MSFLRCERRCMRPMLEQYTDALSVKDLSEIFNISAQTIRKELNDGKFGAPFKIGREFRVSKNFVIEMFIHSPALTKGGAIND